MSQNGDDIIAKLRAIDRQIRWFDLKRKLLRPFRLVRQQYENLVRALHWIPRIWGTREWDHYFLFQILEWKLSDMEAFYRSGRAMSSHAARTARDIMVAKNLCRRLKHECYTSPWDNWAEDIPEGWLRREGGRFRPYPEAVEKKIKRHTQRRDEMIRQDLDLLTKIIRTKVLTWWD